MTWISALVGKWRHLVYRVGYRQYVLPVYRAMLLDAEKAVAETGNAAYATQLNDLIEVSSR